MLLFKLAPTETSRGFLSEKWKTSCKPQVEEFTEGKKSERSTNGINIPAVITTYYKTILEKSHPSARTQ